MGLSCGSQFAKGILVFFNILIWICGGVVLGVGIWFLVDEDASKLLHIATLDTSLALVRGTAYALVTVGGVAFITGFFGCCGAMRESPCMLNTYAIILSMLLVLQVAAGIAGVVFKDRIDSELEKSMNSTVTDKYLYNVSDDTSIAFDFMQREFKCCGSSVGPIDWKESAWKSSAPNTENVPVSCCVTYKNNTVVDATKCQDLAYSNTPVNNKADYVYVEGCKEQLSEWIREHAGIVIGVAFGLAIVQIISIILACSLKNNVNSQYQYV